MSPLISLMKDQVDTLVGNGVPAALFNSSLGADEKATVMRGLAEQRSAALRLARAARRRRQRRVLTRLAGCGVRFIAIDEAHCISQWGHDFRPEYRQLARLRERFPGVAMHAYTATATERVRRDIASQLALRDRSSSSGRSTGRTSSTACCRGPR